MNADGTGLKALTDDKGRDIVLDWQARPTSVAPELTVYRAVLDPRKPVTLRYSVRDDDALRLGVDPAQRAQRRAAASELGGSPDRVRAGRAPRRDEARRPSSSGVPREPRPRLPFCVSAIDPTSTARRTPARKLTARKPKRKG